MLVNFNKLLKNAPLVEAKKFSRANKINLDGYCSPYLFAEYPKCKCEGVRWSNDEIGITCNTCGVEVIKNTGLGKYELGEELLLLHPAIYGVLKKMKKIIVKTVTKTDINGFIVEDEDSDNDKFLSYVKLLELETNKERVDYLRNLVKSFSSKKVPDFIKLLDMLETNNQEDLLFIKRIPVIHLRFRSDERGEQSELNKIYGSLLRTIETLQESSELRKTLDASLYGVQELLHKVGEFLIDIDALQNYFFPSVSFSSRSPVLSAPLTDDFRGITIGYAVYKTIYKFRIIHFLRKKFGYSYQNALNEVIYKHQFGSEEFNSVLEEIKKEAVMMINRVPSLMLENLIACKLNDVIEDSVFLTPQIVFKYLSQDSDGDVISCIPLFTKEAKEKAIKIYGIENFLKSKYNFNERKISSYVRGYNKYGAHLLAEKLKEERSKGVNV